MACQRLEAFEGPQTSEIDVRRHLEGCSGGTATGHKGHKSPTAYHSRRSHSRSRHSQGQLPMPQQSGTALSLGSAMRLCSPPRRRAVPNAAPVSLSSEHPSALASAQSTSLLFLQTLSRPSPAAESPAVPSFVVGRPTFHFPVRHGTPSSFVASCSRFAADLRLTEEKSRVQPLNYFIVLQKILEALLLRGQPSAFSDVLSLCVWHAELALRAWPLLA